MVATRATGHSETSPALLRTRRQQELQLRQNRVSPTRDPQRQQWVPSTRLAHAWGSAADLLAEAAPSPKPASEHSSSPRATGSRRGARGKPAWAGVRGTSFWTVRSASGVQEAEDAERCPQRLGALRVRAGRRVLSPAPETAATEASAGSPAFGNALGSPAFRRESKRQRRAEIYAHSGIAAAFKAHQEEAWLAEMVLRGGRDWTCEACQITNHASCEWCLLCARSRNGVPAALQAGPILDGERPQLAWGRSRTWVAPATTPHGWLHEGGPRQHAPGDARNYLAEPGAPRSERYAGPRGSKRAGTRRGVAANDIVAGAMLYASRFAETAARAAVVAAQAAQTTPGAAARRMAVLVSRQAAQVARAEAFRARVVSMRKVSTKAVRPRRKPPACNSGGAEMRLVVPGDEASNVQQMRATAKDAEAGGRCRWGRVRATQPAVSTSTTNADVAPTPQAARSAASARMWRVRRKARGDTATAAESRLAKLPHSALGLASARLRTALLAAASPPTPNVRLPSNWHPKMRGQPPLLLSHVPGASDK